MKKFKVLSVFLVLLLAGTNVYSQDYYYKKYNELLKRTEYFDSNDNMISYKEWNPVTQRYEIHNVKNQNTSENYPRKVRTYDKPKELIDFNFLTNALAIKQQRYNQEIQLRDNNEQRLEYIRNILNSRFTEVENVKCCNKHLTALNQIIFAYNSNEKIRFQLRNTYAVNNRINTWLGYIKQLDRIILEQKKEKEEKKEKRSNFFNRWHSYKTYPKTIPNGWHRVAVVSNDFFADRDRKVYVENNKITKYVKDNWRYREITETESIVNGRASIELRDTDNIYVYFIDSVIDPQSTASAPKLESDSGRVLFWTNANDGETKLYIEGKSIHTSAVISDDEPECSYKKFNYENLIGTYNFRAETTSRYSGKVIRTWEGKITIEEGCKTFKLEK